MSWRRLLAAGVIATAVAGIGGRLLELSQFGRTEDEAVARVHQHVRERFGAMVSEVADVSSRIASDPASAEALAAGTEGARTLFDLVDHVRHGTRAPDAISVTIYEEMSREARAWAGRPSDIPRERVAGPSAVFVTQAPLGLRLVHVQPVVAASGRRAGAVATEHVLSPAPAPTAIGPADYTIDTPIAPASLRLRFDADRERPGTLLLREPSGKPLIEVEVDRNALATARARWRLRVLSAATAVFAVTLFLLAGPLLDRRAATRDARIYRRTTLLAIVLTVAGSVLLWRAVAQMASARLQIPAALLIAGATAAVFAALLAGPAARLRVALRTHRTFAASAFVAFAATQALAGAAVAAMIILFHILLDRGVDPGTVDLRHLSLHPWGDGTRILLLAGILAVHVAVLWLATLTLSAASAPWRVPRSGWRPRLLLLVLWLAPSVAGAVVAVSRQWPVSALDLLLSAGACAVAALLGARLVVWYRRTTVAARILALFAAFLGPALLLYPSMDFFAERATRRLIETQYTVQAQNHVQTLLERLAEAQREIDQLAILPELVTGAPPAGAGLGTPTDSAFFVWRQTALARGRLTSAVELYDIKGTLVSRFALNIPEYTVASPAPQMTSGCAWDVFGEVMPFGSEERRMLHAERRICTSEGEEGPLVPRGTIILHVVLEYETLPFISSQNPYFEVFRPTDMAVASEGTTGGNVEVAIYGWGLQPLYTSGRTVWPLTDELFDRIYASREPFWDDVRTPGARHQVYFSNDRDRIFAIGHPVLSVFDHFVHLAELTTLAAVGFVLVLLGTAVFTRIGRERPRMGRALLREIRASFYRKLFLAFVLAAIIPVLTLAFVIRTYFANLMRADVEAEAARTAITARRVIEEADAPLRRTTESAVGPFNDDVMIWISQVVDQDVNVFLGPRLAATSERDLFASGLLPTRTPVDVYRAIVLQRLPTYVGEDQIGDLPYMLAAAPVRAAGGDGVLTVPLGNRQREIDREIDDLDRGVHLAAVFFVLLGAAIGLSMAERIADPVRRLTRATRRIARGDFDERIAVRSADELKRLVDAFNSMAAELKAQRAQLERTHRLEAWAEMARQVAHEIKNPLTPIQLSAEHLQRVHADRGEPMGPVLDSCVSAILGQVRLLRQISAEFSSFASSPTARPSHVDLAPLIAEVVDPYRTGLAGRISVANNVTSPLPHVLVDRTLVARALSNIVENALHAMPGAGALSLDPVVTDGFVAITVRDTGVGMDEEALTRVFEPYFSTKTTGTGLGLTIARRNVELSGGTIEVKSVKGEGTAVTIKLPIAEARRAAL